MNFNEYAYALICKPYPDYRLPGWNRLSAGLHLGDMQKFYEDQGRQAYNKRLPIPLLTGKGRSHHHLLPVVRCGYEFSNKSLFCTYDGIRLGAAFSCVYVPREEDDVYAAAIGVSGSGANALGVNFGGRRFVWEEANEERWRMSRRVGYFEDAGAPLGYSR